MEIANFIVIDDALSSKRTKTKNLYCHTVNGAVFMPVNVSLPVIRKGQGCIGIGVVTELRINANSTQMYFNVFECSKEAANAYYALYRNQLTTSASAMDDVYDNTDVIIPGAIQNVKPSPRSSSANWESRDRVERYSSLSQFDNLDSDDVHW